MDKSLGINLSMRSTPEQGSKENRVGLLTVDLKIMLLGNTHGVIDFQNLTEDLWYDTVWRVTLADLKRSGIIEEKIQENVNKE